jgi:hypothetical protein
MFGDVWSGDLEYRARHDLRTRAELDYLSKTSGSWARPANWEGPWVGWTIRRPYPDEGSDEYEAERLARARFEGALDEFLKELESTTIKAAALDKNGKLHRIAPAVWRSARAHYYLEKGKGPAGDYYRNRERFVHEGELLIEASSAPPPPQTTDGCTSISPAELFKLVDHVADGTLTESQVKAKVKDQCEVKKRRFTDKMWRDSWKRISANKKRSRGETDKAIKSKSGG